MAEGWGTIKVPKETFEKHRQRKDDMDMKWAEYLEGQAPEYVEEREVLEALMREAAREGAKEAVEEVARS